MEPSWHLQMRQANHQHTTRSDTQCLRFEDRPSRLDITHQYYSAHESRFERPKSNLLVANEPEIADVKLARMTGRKSQLFSMPEHVPLPCGARNVTHGGLFYDQSAHSKIIYHK